MSKWGIEEAETLQAIDEIGLGGNILNVASGDGRFNNRLLELSSTVIAIDKDEIVLRELSEKCPDSLRKKLITKVVDITKKLPFEDNAFDGMLCIGTLHLFNIETIKYILSEIKRTLKVNGKIVFDFATDIIRLDKNGDRVVFDNESGYTLDEGIKLFKSELEGFSIHIETATFKEEALEEEVTGYQSIRGNFFVVSGTKEKE
ncbi:MAG: class I SAM-dependent methyltransferase [Oscillospiraceae bacterium]|nr:class I SAM-dependent methyltransferase [Oscillospiraceae bacterium]